MGGMYSVCHSCYYLCATEQSSGKHTHVNSHYKRAIDCCDDDIKCRVCKQNLYQVISPEVCVMCTKPEEHNLVNHRIDKSFFKNST